MGVFQVHHLVADVVGGFHQVNQRMAGVAQRFAFPAEASDTQFFSYFPIIVCFGSEEAEFLFVSGKTGGIGVFHDGGQRGVGQNETAGSASAELVGQQPEGIGVSFEMNQVFPFFFRNQRAQALSFPFGEIGADGLFA